MTVASRSSMAVLALVLAACQGAPADQQVPTYPQASGPIPLSDDVRDLYEIYRQETVERAFVVSTDGVLGYVSRCPEGVTCGGDVVGPAFDQCVAQGADCVVYDINGRPAFAGDVSGSGSTLTISGTVD